MTNAWTNQRTYAPTSRVAALTLILVQLVTNVFAPNILSQTTLRLAFLGRQGVRRSSIVRLDPFLVSKDRIASTSRVVAFYAVAPTATIRFQVGNAVLLSLISTRTIQIFVEVFTSHATQLVNSAKKGTQTTVYVL